MSKDDIIRKLTSRKWWMALIALVSGIATMIWGEEVATKIGGLLLQLAAVIAYTIGEGLVDAANKHPKAEAAEDEACEKCDIGDYLKEGGEDNETP